MNIKSTLERIFFRSSKGNIPYDELEYLANLMSKMRGEMNDWDKMIGILCSNIWHSSSQVFQKSNDIRDIEVAISE